MADRRRFRRRLADAVEGAATWALFGMLRLLPLDAASAVAGKLARLVGPRLSTSRRAARNLRRAMPELDEAAIARTIAGMWENLGRVAGEYPHLAEMSVYRGDRIEMVGAEIVDRMREDGTGAIFFSGHLGNWEIASLSCTQRGLPLTHVYRAANNPHAERLYRHARRPVGGTHFPKGGGGARAVVAALKRGDHVGMLVDQKLNEGIAVPFFGRDAMTAPAVAEFALRFRVPVVPARVIRLDGARFRLEVLPPIELPDTGDREADVREILCRINAVLEGWIREHPEQWLWLHRRWPD